MIIRMKKLLTLILSITMLNICINCAYPVSAADISENLQRKIDLVAGLRLMDTDENGDFFPDSYFTRAEMADLAVRIVEFEKNYSSEADDTFIEKRYAPWVPFEGYYDYWGTASGATGTQASASVSNKGIYLDVSESSADYENIKKVTEYGIMNGHDTNMFCPDDNITGIEAVATILNILLYKPMVALYGGYPQGYIELGKMNDITVAGYNSPITRGELAVLLVEAFDINSVESSGEGDNVIFKNTGHTMLERFLKLEKISGVVTKNGKTSFTGRSGLAHNQVEIAGDVFYTSDKTAYVQDMIGREVECYYFNYETERGGEVVYAGKTKNNEELTVTLEEFKSYSGNLFTWEDKESGKKHTEKINANPYYIYNGVAVDSCLDEYFASGQGSVVLVSSDGDETYDLMIIESAQTMYVGAVYEQSGKTYIVNKLVKGNESTMIIEPDDVGQTVCIYNTDGKAAALSDIKTDLVLDVIKNGEYIKIYISDKAVYGFKVSSKFTDNGKSYISDGESEYSTSYDYENSEEYTEFQSVSTYNLYLNSYNKIAYALPEGSTVSNFGYLKRIWYDENTEETGVNIVTASKTKESFTVAERIKLSDSQGNDNKYLKADAFYTKIKNIMEEKNSGIAVRYKATRDGILTELELPLEKGIKATTDDRLYTMLSKEESTNGNHRLYNNTISSKFFFDEASKILTLPDDGQGNISDDLSKYNIVTYNSLKTQDNPKVDAYGVNQNSPVISYMLYYDEAGSRVDGMAIMHLVQDISTVVDSDDEIVQKIKVLNISTQTQHEYYLQSDVIPNGVVAVTQTGQPESTIMPNDYYQLSEGDVIVFNADMTGYISNIAIIFDADGEYNNQQYLDDGRLAGNADLDVDFKATEKGILAGTVGYWSKIISNTNPVMSDIMGVRTVGNNTVNKAHMGSVRYILGYVYSVSGDYVTFTTVHPDLLGGKLPEDGERAIYETRKIYNNWGYTDLSESELTIGKVKDNQGIVRSYKEHGSDCSRILLRSYSTATAEALIINSSIKER